MRIYTAHLKADREPILVREGWSSFAALFWPFWLLAQRAWLPGVVLLAVTALIRFAAPPGLQPVFSLALAVLTGVLGRDVIRWSLERRGYVEAHVLAARDEDGALGRLLAVRPDLIPSYQERLK